MEIVKILSEAKQRIYDLYAEVILKNSELNSGIQESYAYGIKDTLDKITMDDEISTSYGEAAKYIIKDKKIRINKNFLKLTEDEKIAVLIHELNHALSYQNKNGVIHFIEEGCADLIAELSMNHYYNKHNIPKEKRYDPLHMGNYQNAKDIMKTTLLLLKKLKVNDDNNFIIDYVLKNKNREISVLFINLLGSDNYYQIINEENNEYKMNNTDPDIYDEYCKEISKTLFSRLDKMGYIDEFKDLDNEDVYKEDNSLLYQILVSKKVNDIINENEGKVPNIDIIKKMNDDTNESIQFTLLDGYILNSIKKFILETIDEYGEEKVYNILEMVGFCKIFKDDSTQK